MTFVLTAAVVIATLVVMLGVAHCAERWFDSHSVNVWWFGFSVAGLLFARTGWGRLLYLVLSVAWALVLWADGRVKANR